MLTPSSLCSKVLSKVFGSYQFNGGLISKALVFIEIAGLGDTYSFSGVEFISSVLKGSAFT